MAQPLPMEQLNKPVVFCWRSAHLNNVINPALQNVLRKTVGDPYTAKCGRKDKREREIMNYTDQCNDRFWCYSGGNEDVKMDDRRLESPTWTELGMIQLEGQQRWEKCPRKCMKVG